MINLLLSYHYHKQTDVKSLYNFFDGNIKIFADSGAYSALTQGVKITIDEYADWVKKNQSYLTVYANLDVIMNPEKTWGNQKYLEIEHGLSPIPVFHVNTDFSWYEKYLDKYDYIALGVAGMQTRKPALMRWLTKCHLMARDKALLHGFGLTGFDIMYTFPWHSVDSSAWTKSLRFGKLMIFDNTIPRCYDVDLGHHKLFKHREIFSRYGFDVYDFVDRSRNTRENLAAINIVFYRAMEEFIQQQRDKSKMIYHAVMNGTSSGGVENIKNTFTLYFAEPQRNAEDFINGYKTIQKNRT